MTRTRSRWRVALAAASATAVVASAVAGASPAGASAKPYPVSYNFLASAVLAGTQVDADPTGGNIWTCKPSAAHPEPVVLVHGTGGNKNDNWQTYAPLLANNGYCVFSLTYGVLPNAPVVLNQVGGLDRIETSAGQLKAFVTKVLTATGARKVDIVGHSQGTLMPDYYAKFLGGGSKIDKYVSLAPLWHGTNVGPLGQLASITAVFGIDLVDSLAPSLTEMGAGSAFMTKMRNGGVAVPGIQYTNIATAHDELVTPYTSGIEPGMTNIVVQSHCSADYTEHFEIAADPVAAAYVLNALDPAHPRPVPCRVVLPFIGPIG